MILNVRGEQVHPHTVEIRFEAVVQYLFVPQLLNDCTLSEARMSDALWQVPDYPFGLQQQQVHLLFVFV